MIMSAEQWKYQAAAAQQAGLALCVSMAIDVP